MQLAPGLALLAVLGPLHAAAAPPAARAKAAPMTTCCAIVELRQYTTYPGRRDALIELFDRELVETQEAVGIRVIGQFRDEHDPDRFVWLRGFAGMPERKQALTDFYTGPVWGAHRAAANATMYDSDNVLLLHPARSTTRLDLAQRTRTAAATAPGYVAITTYAFAQPVPDDFITWFDDTLRPVHIGAGARILAELVSEDSENTFPRLPVRTGEHVFLWIAEFADRDAYLAYLAALARDPRWRDNFARLHKQLAKPPELLRLAPTARSLVGRPR